MQCLTHDGPYCLLLLLVVAAAFIVVDGISRHHDFYIKWKIETSVCYKECVLTINKIRFEWPVSHHKWKLSFFSVSIIFNLVSLYNSLL